MPAYEGGDFGYRFRGPFVVAESDYGLLGRNILNQLVCTLDGPGQVWSA